MPRFALSMPQSAIMSSPRGHSPQSAVEKKLAKRHQRSIRRRTHRTPQATSVGASKAIQDPIATPTATPAEDWMSELDDIGETMICCSASTP